MSGNHYAYQFEEWIKSKELLGMSAAQLVMLAQDNRITIEAQAKETERLSALCDKWNSECDEMRDDNKRLDAENAELRAALVECNSALEGAYDYVEDAINEYIAGHGESFRPQRLQYIRDRKADCDKALTRCKEVLNVDK